MKALYITLGCKLNFAETSTLATLLAERGVAKAAQGEEPDVVVVNTCSVTEVADRKCRQAIRSLHRRHPGAAIAVTGCYAQLKPADVAALEGVAIVAGNDEKGRLARFVDEWLAANAGGAHCAGPRVEVGACADIHTFTPSCSRGDRTRYFLKVQDGCDWRCSYCTIPRARGRSRSPGIDSLVAQARAVAEAGGREIVLTGVNIGHFGGDAERRDGRPFMRLCRALDEVEGIDRYRISSLEPDLLPDELIDWMAGSRAFMPHFHLPLQNGSDAVLAIMRRRYRAELFARKVERIRAAMPDAFIGVDLIVGMRGETPALFDESRAFVESLDISRLHVFTYSERPGTDALAVTPVVTPEEKHARTRVMLDVSDAMLRRFTGRFAGSTRPVLVEHAAGPRTLTGHTDNYLPVSIPAAPGIGPNTLLPVALTTENLGL